jgi:hypothetical protein
VGESPGSLVLEDTWRLIKSGRHLGYHDFEIQGSTPFHPRYTRCEGAFGCRPTVIAQGRMERRLEEGERELPVGESPKGSGPLVLKDTWSLIKSGRHLSYHDFEIQGSTPFHPRYARCEGAFGCRPMVIAPGLYGVSPKKVSTQGQGCLMEK